MFASLEDSPKQEKSYSWKGLCMACGSLQGDSSSTWKTSLNRLASGLNCT